jgi:hypothetical protein
MSTLKINIFIITIYVNFKYNEIEPKLVLKRSKYNLNNIPEVLIKFETEFL